MVNALRLAQRIDALTDRWEIEKQKRWPAGNPKGGQFAPTHGGGSGSKIVAPQYGMPKPKAFGGLFSAADDGEHEKPKGPPPGWKPHPRMNDKGEPVAIHYPTKGSHPATWTDPRSVATFTPGGDAPAKLNGVAMKPWAKVPQDLDGWAKVPGQNPAVDADVPFEPVHNKNVGAGVIIREPDGRVWLTRPTNSFGGYQHTWPKGTVEQGLSLQASAIKEAYEETGLQVRIVGVLGDYERTTSKARYYVAERIGGTPKDMGWESQALRLAPAHKVGQLLNMKVDRGIADDFFGEMLLKRVRSTPRTLYVSRRLVNGPELVAWAKGAGFATTPPPEDLHVTVAFSREPVRWDAVPESFDALRNTNGARSLKRFGEAVVLAFTSAELQTRWQQFRDAGASWDHPSYQPHVTITYAAPADLDLATVEPYSGPLIFGPERFAPVKEDWHDDVTEKAKGGKGSFRSDQPRWPAGSPLGGQWKKMGSDGLTLPPSIAGGLGGKNPAYQKKADALHAMAQKGDLTMVAIAVSQLTDKVAADKAAGKSSSHVKWTAQLHQFGAQVLGDMGAKVKAVASADAITGPQKLSALVPVGAKPGGSNPGGMYSDGKGSKILIKGNLQLANGKVSHAVSDDRAKNEVLAAHLIKAAGGGAPDMHLVDLEGKYGGGLGVASKMVTGNVVGFNPSNASHLAAIQKDFALHAWLGNYDVLGQGFDNTVIHDGKAVNIDPGGAILFRAQGLPKDNFGKDASEWESMRSFTAEQKAVFGKMTGSQLQESAQALSMVDDATVKKLVDTYGPGDAKAKADLTETLIARRDAILEKAGLKTFNISAGVSVLAQPVPPPAPPVLAQAVQPPAGNKVPAGVSKPTFSTGFKGPDDYYNGLSDKAAALHAAGDLEGLKALGKKKNGGNAWPVKTVNGQKMSAFHGALVADLEGSKAQAVQAVASGTATVTSGGKTWRAENGVLNPVPVAASAGPAPGLSKATVHALMMGIADPGSTAPGDYLLGGLGVKTPVGAMAALAEKGDIEGLKAYKVKSNQAKTRLFKEGLLNALVAGPPAAQASVGLPKAKIATLIDRAFGQDYSAQVDYLTTSKVGDTTLSPTSKAMVQAAERGDLEALKAVSPKGNISQKFKQSLINAMGVQPSAAAAAAATVTATSTASLNAAQAAMPNFEKAKLKPENKNAASHNPKVDKIAALAGAGDVKGLLALNYGTNTYGQQQAKLANDALAALGSPHQVTKGQKANVHPALVGGSVQVLAGPAPKVRVATPKPPPVISTTAAKPKPVFNPQKITAPPSFTNFNGQGKGLSSVATVNVANDEAVQTIYQTALKGDLAEMKALTYDEVDKGTGQKTGNKVFFANTSKPHPSKHVDAYFQNTLSEIDLQLNPPVMTPVGRTISAGAWDGGFTKLLPVPSGVTVKAVPKHARIGDYIALGLVERAGVKSVSESNSAIDSSAWRSAALSHYNKAPQAAKSTFQTYLSSSGAGALNEALRSGNLNKTVGSKSVKQHVEDFKALLVDVPEGSTFVRNMGHKGYGAAPDTQKLKALEQFLMTAEKGTVVQEPGFTSSSHGTSILGGNNIQWRFTAAKGVKVFPGWLGANTGEGEGLFPPNQRYMIMGAKKNGKTVVVEAILLPTI